MEQKEISKAVISRLPRYYRYLGELLEEGVERISSNDLSIRMKVTASQIRQDLNNFGGFGQQGYGYNVKYLYSEIARILGIDRQHNLIIIGAGNLGQAIANYTNFERRGFIIKGMFDVNPRLVRLEELRTWNSSLRITRCRLQLLRFRSLRRLRSQIVLSKPESKPSGTLLIRICRFPTMS